MTGTWLVILLVVVWLFVLVPMVTNTREPIRRTTAALAETRLLHRGDGSALKPRRRLRPARSEYVPEEDELEDDAEDPADEAAADTAVDAGSAGEELVTRPATTTVVVDWDGDVVEDIDSPAAELEGEEVLPEADAAGGEVVDAEYEEYEDPDPDSDELAGAAVGSGEVDHEDAEDAEDAGCDDVAAYEDEDDAYEDEDEDEDDAGDDAVAELADPEHEDESDFGHLAGRGIAELDDADRDFAARRRGRGGYDPEADLELSEKRHVRRQRTLSALLAVVAVTVGVAVFVNSGLAWGAVGMAAIAVVVYLVGLRRAVMQEQELRRRRIARMRRARLGVESREDRELSVVPERLRRPGAIVLETDDEDPVFDHLPHRRGVTRGNGRGDGSRDHMGRAAG